MALSEQVGRPPLEVGLAVPPFADAKRTEALKNSQTTHGTDARTSLEGSRRWWWYLGSDESGPSYMHQSGARSRGVLVGPPWSSDVLPASQCGRLLIEISL